MKASYTQNTNPCKSTKLRMVIGGWTEHYVNHDNNWVAFNIHGERVNVYDYDPDTDIVVFKWGFNTLKTTIGSLIKAMSLINKWLEV